MFLSMRGLIVYSGHPKDVCLKYVNKYVICINTSEEEIIK